MTDLVARTRRLDAEVDLLAASGGKGLVFERDSVGLAGRGAAMETPVGEAAGVLAAIDVDDGVGLPGCGPVAFGALPFRPDPAATLVVPETLWGRAADGTRWVTTVGPGGGAAPPVEPPAQAAPGELPGRLTIAPSKPAAWWCELVAQATKALGESPAEGLRKVVLARDVTVEADVAFDLLAVLGRLRQAYPSCFVFSVDGFLGASPELFVSRADDVVRAQPMAGTAPRGGEPGADARLAATLMESATYRSEHQIAIDMIHDTLVPWCSYLDYEPEPSVVAVANVQHLATTLEGRLSQPAPSVLALVEVLHPTPAVAGWPRDEAVAWIEAHEKLDRGRYAGSVGWVDGRGNGTCAVSVRCAEVAGATARLWAGGGIVADADPATELSETQAKLQALLGALIRV